MLNNKSPMFDWLLVWFLVFFQYVEHGLRISRRPYALSTGTKWSREHGRSRWPCMEAISYITSAEGAFSTRIGLLLPLTVLEGRVLQIIKYVYSLDEIYEIQFFNQASQFPKVWLLLVLIIRGMDIGPDYLYIDKKI